MKKLSLKKVSIVGFGVYHSFTEVDFEPGITHITASKARAAFSNSNGAGKTTILNAITWALFGRTPKGVSKDAVMNHSSDMVEVTVEFDRLEVTRVKHRGHTEKLSFTFNNRTSRKKKLSVQQQKLIDILGVDFETYCNSIFLGSGSRSVQFLAATPAQRTKILERLVNVTPFQKAGKLAWRKLKKLENRIKTIQSEITSIDDRIRDAEAAYYNWQVALSQAEASNREEKIRHKSRILTIKSKLEKAKAILNKVPEMTMQELNKSRRELTDTVRASEIQIGTLTESLAQREDLEAGDLCPTCRRPVKQKHVDILEDSDNKMKEQISLLTEGLGPVKAKLRIVEDQMEELRTLKSDKARASADITELKREYKILKDASLGTKTDTLKQNIEEVAAKIKNLKASKTLKIRKMVKMTSKEPYYRKIHKYMQHEIKNYVLDHTRQQLHNNVQEYIDEFTGGELGVKFPLQTKTGQERFEIIAYKEDVEQELSSFSDGEGWKLTFSLLMALRDLLIDSNKCRLNLLFVDDPLGALDDTGLGIFSESLYNLRNSIEHIILTVPREVQDLKTDNKIHIHVNNKGVPILT